MSVVEALAAIAILGIGLGGLAVNSVAGTHRVKNADATAAAHALVQQKLEQLRSLPLGDTQHTPGQYYDSANNLKADGTSGGTFNRSWQVSLKDTPSFGLKTVTVTVAWNDGASHSTKMAAYVRCSTIPCP
jgi:type II secretory pathway pseudopilin PulG